MLSGNHKEPTQSESTDDELAIKLSNVLSSPSSTPAPLIALSQNPSSSPGATYFASAPANCDADIKTDLDKMKHSTLPCDWLEGYQRYSEGHPDYLKACSDRLVFKEKKAKLNLAIENAQRRYGQLSDHLSQTSLAPDTSQSIQDAMVRIEGEFRNFTELLQILKEEHAITKQFFVSFEKEVRSLANQHAAQVTRLINWFLKHKFNYFLENESIRVLAGAIAGARNYTPPTYTHPSDVLWILNLFVRLIEPELFQTAQQNKKIQDIFIVEIALISHLLATKYHCDEAPWISDYVHYIKSDFYLPLFQQSAHQLEQASSKSPAPILNTYRMNKTQKDSVIRRLRMLEAESLKKLDYNLEPKHLDLKDLNRLLQDMEFCNKQWHFLNRLIQVESGQIDPLELQKIQEVYQASSESVIKRISQISVHQNPLRSP